MKLARGEKVALTGIAATLAVGVMGAGATLVAGSAGSTSPEASRADSDGCPTLVVPSEIHRGGGFAIQNADGYQPGEAVNLVLSPGGVLRQLYARENGSFAGANIVVPADAPAGKGTVTAERPGGGCETSADVVVR